MKHTPFGSAIVSLAFLALKLHETYVFSFPVPVRNLVRVMAASCSAAALTSAVFGQVVSNYFFTSAYDSDLGVSVEDQQSSSALGRIDVHAEVGGVVNASGSIATQLGAIEVSGSGSSQFMSGFIRIGVTSGYGYVTDTVLFSDPLHDGQTAYVHYQVAYSSDGYFQLNGGNATGYTDFIATLNGQGISHRIDLADLPIVSTETLVSTVPIGVPVELDLRVQSIGVAGDGGTFSASGSLLWGGILGVSLSPDGPYIDTFSLTSDSGFDYLAAIPEPGAYASIVGALALLGVLGWRVRQTWEALAERAL